MHLRTKMLLLVGAATACVALNASAQTVEETLRQFDAEPTIREVQEVAAAYAQIDEGVISGWTTRANLSPLLPDLRARYQTDTDDDRQDDDRQDFVVDEFGDLVLESIDRDVRLEDDNETRWLFQGDWELNELVWNPELLRISKETRDLVELREDVLTTVTSLYFERRRAQVQLLMDPPRDEVERLRRELEIQELTAGLDALTGGWFSEALSAAGLPSY